MTYGNSALGNSEYGSTATESRPTLQTQAVTAEYTVNQGKLLILETQKLDYTYSLQESSLLDLNLDTQAVTATYTVNSSTLQTGLIYNKDVKYKITPRRSTLTGTTTAKSGTVQASATLNASSLSGTTTLKTESASAAYTVNNLVLKITLLTESVNYTAGLEPSKFTKLATQKLRASYTVGTSTLQDLNLDSQAIKAEYTVQEAGFDVLGTKNEVTVLIEGRRVDTYTNIEIQKRLNEIDTFSFEAFIEDSEDRSLINEGNIVKIIEDYNTLLFKGKLTDVEYQSSFRAKCEGDGMATKLLNRKTNRDTYSNTPGDDIVKAEVPDTFINYGTIEAAPQVSVRFDHDNLARAVAGVANATGYDWFIDQHESDGFDTDYLNFVEDAGSDTAVADLVIGEDARMVEREKDEGFVANNITLLGRGDGINQLEAQVFAASTAYTDTTEQVSATESTSIAVEDATQLGSTGDNLIVRVGTEVMDVTVSDTTTLSVNSRGLDDYKGDATQQIQHYAGVRIWRLENKTTGVGRFTPETRDSAEDGSSIEAKGVKEQRETDKTIVDLSTLEKVADLELKNRFEDVYRVEVDLTEPNLVGDIDLGDKVNVQDLTAMDVDDTFEVVGMDIRRSSAEEGTALHLANRPRRLTERLSEIESDRDTLNAHMQGATNFNGERFSDNADETHPLTNKVFVPDDVVKINKFQLTFARESFRGYTESTEEESQHTHEFEVDIPEHDHEVTIDIPDHTHQLGDLFTTRAYIDDPDFGETTKNISGSATFEAQDEGTDSVITSSVVDPNNIGKDHQHAAFGGDEFPFDLKLDITSIDTLGVLWPESIYRGETLSFVMELDFSEESGQTTASGGGYFTSPTTDDGGSEFISDTTQAGSAHSHGVNYGIFEPGSEPDIDVEVYVDGNLVTTINNVSVGDEITDPINLKNYLADPLTGQYHDIKLKPVDTGGGNNGRCKLSADIVEKVFIESTL